MLKKRRKKNGATEFATIFATSKPHHQPTAGRVTQQDRRARVLCDQISNVVFELANIVYIPPSHGPIPMAAKRDGLDLGHISESPCQTVKLAAKPS